MSKSGGKSKKGGGLRVFWLPTGHKSHKHKKNKYYAHDNFDSPKSAMMSGDSPNSHGKDYFDFKEKEGRSTPPPTTSKDISVQSSSGGKDAKGDIVSASVLAEPPKEHGPGTNFVGIIDGHSEHKNDDEIVSTEDKPLRNDDRPEAGDKKDAPKKLNGTIDKLDGNWVPPAEKKEDDEEEDNCGVKCLYYTLQCCECTVM